MPELSVIVPYYNVDMSVFKKCLESIENQTFRDFELLIVDDGSTAELHTELVRLLADEERVILLTQHNQGVSAARNYGVREAKGAYIIFVDADDIVMPYHFEEAIRVAKEKSADIVYGYEHVTENENYVPFHDSDPLVKCIDEGWLKKYTLGYLYTDGEKLFGRGPYARIIKSELAKSVLFYQDVPIGEDVIWNLEVLKKTDNRYLVDQIWYLYIDRNTSVTHKYNPEIERKLLPFYTHVEDSLGDSQEDKKYYYARLDRDLRRYIFLLFLGNKNNTDCFLKRWKQFNQLCGREPWRKLSSKEWFELCDIKGKIYIILFKTRLLFPYRSWRTANFHKKRVL